MKITEVTHFDYDSSNGDEYKSIIPITPHIVIRDFEGSHDEHCDIEFYSTQLEEAWGYFQSVGSHSRLIDGAESIFYCYYIAKEEVSK
jgi:hypothetical protein